VLEAANLVTTMKTGRTKECRLGPGDMDEATTWIEHYRDMWERRFDRLEALVERRNDVTARRGASSRAMRGTAPPVDRDRRRE
jgi:hypothetical protein